MAAGVSFNTWAKARADVKKRRPDHAGRKKRRAREHSVKRLHLEAYIRDLRNGLEGPKGGSDPRDKWHVDKMTVPKRWEQYKDHRMKRGLPVLGSFKLFAKIWSEHREIVQVAAKGHAKCDRYVCAFLAYL